MRLALQEAGKSDGLPDKVCPVCYQELATYVPQGAKLRFERKAQEANKMNLWKTRVTLVKQGRTAMTKKNFSAAAIAYEKYIKVLEVVYDCPPGELKPSHFKNSSRAKELTLIASVYWDLMRIYDSNNRYLHRQQKAGLKLAEFARFTKIYPSLVKNAKAFSKTAKNREVFKNFVKTAQEDRPSCFIATAAFEDSGCFEVHTLRQFRDLYLKERRWGRKFILFYYKYSPRVALLIERAPVFKVCTKIILRCTAVPLASRFLLKSRSKF